MNPEASSAIFFNNTSPISNTSFPCYHWSNVVAIDSTFLKQQKRNIQPHTLIIIHTRYALNVQKRRHSFHPTSGASLVERAGTNRVLSGLFTRNK